MKIFKDMDDNQYWSTVWFMCLTTVVLITTAVAWNHSHEDMLVHDLVNKGHDPLELACLFNASNSMEPSCFLLAQEKAKTYATK